MSQQINLFNPVFLKQKKYFSFFAMLQAIALLLIGCMAVVGYAKYRVVHLRQEAEATAAQFKTYEVQLAKAQRDFAPKPPDAKLASEIRRTEDELKALEGVFAVLERGDIGNTQGYSSYFAAFSRQIVDGVWLTGVNLNGAGNDISIEGRALRPDLVPSYMKRLKQEPVMQGKSFGSLEILGESGEQAAAKGGTAGPYVEFRLR